MADESDLSSIVENLRPRWMRRAPAERYELTRFVFLRLLGVVYAVAFLCALLQFRPLCGENGLLPANTYLHDVRAALGSSQSWLRFPTLFWFGVSDTALSACAAVGLGVSLLVACGLANAPMLGVLWVLYLSFVQIGQLFYGYGWEFLLLETGFLAVFLAPPLDPRPFPAKSEAPALVTYLLRWLLFRLMFGAGLIKLRGDPCWRDLTCLVYHYETQPIPNPASWLFHQFPRPIHEIGVLVNHAAELIAPFCLFLPRRFRLAGALTIIGFQLLLIVSGNLSWLNWLTIAIATCSLDDRFFGGLFGRGRLRAFVCSSPVEPLGRLRRGVVIALATLVGALSVNPLVNMLSPGQIMNTGFDPLYLVNTYGAFGTVGRERYEIVVQGTLDDPRDEHAHYFDYELPCKPGNVMRRPCLLSPYHRRLDWQMWFAAMSDYEHDPWVVHLAYKLLVNDAAVLSLFEKSPFGRLPPRAIRVERYRYEFTHSGDPERTWWRQSEEESYLPPLTRDDPELLDFLAGHGWPEADSEEAGRSSEGTLPNGREDAR